MSKMQNISARISMEDAEFLSQLDIEGATTSSEKIRALIQEGRQNRALNNNYKSALNNIQAMLMPINSDILTTEIEINQHSEMISRVIDWLPDITAILVSNHHNELEGSPEDNLMSLEKSITERVFRLIESVLQLALTQNNSCLDSTLINNKMNTIQALTKLIEHTKS